MLHEKHYLPDHYSRRVEDVLIMGAGASRVKETSSLKRSLASPKPVVKDRDMDRQYDVLRPNTPGEK